MQKVLVLEDDIITVSLVLMLLEDAGYLPDHADTTDAAVSSINRGVPDILLSDWTIDGSISAGDVARLLREKNPEAQIIFITGRSADELGAQLSGLDPFTIYQKPVEYEDIISQLPRQPSAV